MTFPQLGHREQLKPHLVNAHKAYTRDEGWCQWCLHRRDTFSEGATPHHIFGRHYDEPKYQITLCQVRKDGSLGCHNRVHDQGDITREDIVQLCIETIWGGEDWTPSAR